MNDSAIDVNTHRDIALRIALAARVLPETDPQRLLKVLDDCIGLPLTQDGLDRLTPGEMKRAANADMSEVPGSMLRQAIAFLKGDIELNQEPLPEIEPYCDDDMPGAIRVACASNSAQIIDGHFGSCARFLIYQVSPTEVRLIDIRSALVADEAPGLNTDRAMRRAELVNDCNMLFVCSIGGPPAARVTRMGGLPVKISAPIEAREKLFELQQRLQKSPPRWMKREVQP